MVEGILKQKGVPRTMASKAQIARPHDGGRDRISRYENAQRIHLLCAKKPTVNCTNIIREAEDQ